MYLESTYGLTQGNHLSAWVGIFRYRYRRPAKFPRPLELWYRKENHISKARRYGQSMHEAIQRMEGANMRKCGFY